MSAKKQAKSSSTKARSKPKSKKPTGKSPVTGWRSVSIQKPKVVIKTGEAKKEAVREEATSRPTLWRVLIGLLPVWLLLIIILILAPQLPIHAAGALIGWIGGLIPERPAAQSEPVFIVEGASAEELVNPELPLPNWDFTISEVFRPEVQYWAEDIAQWSLTYRIKPNMIATVMQIESCGNPHAESHVGAMGLFQVVEIHFEEGEDPYDPETNAYRAMLFLGDLLASVNGDTGLAFAAYNGGPGVLTITPAEWPAETQDYQFWASGIYEEAERQFEESPTLQAWLAAGGSGLCAEAAEALELDE